jgi:hypothetical protein
MSWTDELLNRLTAWLPSQDPFDGPTEQTRAQRRAHAQRVEQVTQQTERLQQAYAALLQHPEFQAIAQDVQPQLGRALRTLVETALGCRHCFAVAHAVRTLHEVIGKPMEVVWQQEHRPAPSPEMTMIPPLD